MDNATRYADLSANPYFVWVSSMGFGLSLHLQVHTVYFVYASNNDSDESALLVDVISTEIPYTGPNNEPSLIEWKYRAECPQQDYRARGYKTFCHAQLN